MDVAIFIFFLPFRALQLLVFILSKFLSLCLPPTPIRSVFVIEPSFQRRLLLSQRSFRRLIVASLVMHRPSPLYLFLFLFLYFRFSSPCPEDLLRLSSFQSFLCYSELFLDLLDVRLTFQATHRTPSQYLIVSRKVDDDRKRSLRTLACAMFSDF